MHYLYKITNNLTKHFYYGCHSTRNMNDGYMGSGVLINKAIAYYGKENFTKEVIMHCKTRAEMFREERKLITREVIQNPNCYNLITGGKRKSKNTFKVKAKTKACKELLRWQT